MSPSAPEPSLAGSVAPAGQLVRCACRTCGAHINALRTFQLVGSCANCGSLELEAIEGAEPLRVALTRRSDPVDAGPLAH